MTDATPRPDPAPGLLRPLASVLVLPGVVVGLVPQLLLRQAREHDTRWVAEGGRSALPDVAVFTRGAALAVGLVGAWLFVTTVVDFARRGRGTLAPWDPPRRLVLSGPYRHVRNPMISGVVLLVLAQGGWLGSALVAGWGALFLVINLVYIRSSEEPALRARFGEAYDTYCRAVPRWIPRLAPWRADPEDTEPAGRAGRDPGDPPDPSPGATP